MSFRKTFESFTEVIKDVARQKRDAASARARGREPGVEPAYQVYQESCRTIADAFADRGYSFAKSGPHFSRKPGDLRYRVSFQTSYHNIPGQYVGMRIAGNVSSLTLKRWRNEQPQPLRQSDAVAGGLIHLLTDEHYYMEWDLADPDTRHEVIGDAIGAIESYIIPYFDQFRDLPTLCQRLRAEDVPAFNIGCALEFLLCYSDRETARRAGQAYLQRHPEFVDDFRQELARIHREGLVDAREFSFTAEVAWASVAYGLDIVA